MSKNTPGWNQGPNYRYRGNQTNRNHQDPRSNQQWQVPAQNYGNPPPLPQSPSQVLSQNFQYGQQQYNPGPSNHYHQNVQPQPIFWQNQNAFQPGTGNQNSQQPVTEFQPNMYSLTKEQLDQTIDEAIERFHHRCHGDQQTMTMQHDASQYSPQMPQAQDQEHVSSNPEPHATDHVKIGEDWIPLANRTKECFQAQLMNFVFRENKKINRASAILEDCEKFWNMLMSGKLKLPSEKDKERVQHDSAAPGPEPQENHNEIVIHESANYEPLVIESHNANDTSPTVQEEVLTDVHQGEDTVTIAPPQESESATPIVVASEVMEERIPESAAISTSETTSEAVHEPVVVPETSQREESAPKSMDKPVEVLIGPVMEIVDRATTPKTADMQENQEAPGEEIKQTNDEANRDDSVDDDEEKEPEDNQPTTSPSQPNANKTEPSNKNNKEKKKKKNKNRKKNKKQPQPPKAELVIPERTEIEKEDDTSDQIMGITYKWQILYYVKHQQSLRQDKQLNLETLNEQPIIIEIMKKVKLESDVFSMTRCQGRLDLLKKEFGQPKPYESVDAYKAIDYRRKLMFLIEMGKHLECVDTQKHLIEDLSFFGPNKCFNDYFNAVAFYTSNHAVTALAAYLIRQSLYRTDGNYKIQTDMKAIEIEIMQAARKRENVEDLEPFNLESIIDELHANLDSFKKGHYCILYSFFHSYKTCNPSSQESKILNFDFHYLKNQGNDAKWTSYLQMFTQLTLDPLPLF